MGVEEEFLIMDCADGHAVALGEVLESLSDDDGLSSEMKQEQIETCTLPRTFLHELAQDITARRTSADATARSVGARSVALATSPLPVKSTTTPGLRYGQMTQRFGLTAVEQLTCGCHVHVEEMRQRYPDASAALIVSPTPYGTCADLEAIVEICHKRGKPLIVDEAWGAQLPFHPETPTWAMSAGADIRVVSVHKMGLGFEQGSIFHLQGNLVDSVRLSQCADVLATTSANTLIYAAMDGWRRQMVQEGKAMIEKALELARGLRRDIDALPGLHVLEDELVHAEASHDLDILHVLIDVSELGISGFRATDWLRENCRVDMGTTDHRRAEAVISISDDKETAGWLLEALRALIAAAPHLPRPPVVVIPDEEDLSLETVMLPRDAFFGPVEVVPAEDAPGRIAAEMATPYPPGVPLLLPGERINKAAIDYLRSGAEAGMVLPDPADPSLKTIRVVREEPHRSL